MDLATQQKATLNRLAQTLDEYLDAVPRQKEPNPPDLMALFARLDAFEKEIGAGYDPQLRHYLHQKSYRKAHNWLRGQESENVKGNCGR